MYCGKLTAIGVLKMHSQVGNKLFYVLDYILMKRVVNRHQ